MSWLTPQNIAVAKAHLLNGPTPTSCHILLEIDDAVPGGAGGLAGVA